MSTHMSVSYCCKSINHKTVIIKITVTDYYNVSVSISLGDLLPQAGSATFLLGLWAGCLLYAPVEKLMAQDTNKGAKWTGLRHDPVGLMLRIGSHPSASVQWLKQITWCWETDSTSLVRGTTESRDSGYGRRDPSRIKVTDAINCTCWRQEFSQLQKSSAGI